MTKAPPTGGRGLRGDRAPPRPDLPGTRRPRQGPRPRPRRPGRKPPAPPGSSCPALALSRSGSSLCPPQDRGPRLGPLGWWWRLQRGRRRPVGAGWGRPLRVSPGPLHQALGWPRSAACGKEQLKGRGEQRKQLTPLIKISANYLVTFGCYL